MEATNFGFSLKEAVVLSGMPEAAIRKALEIGAIVPLCTPLGSVSRYRFRNHDLLCLALLHEFPLPLPTSDKLDLWRLLTGRQPAVGTWRWDRNELVAGRGDVSLRIDVQPLVARLVKRLRAYHRGKRRVVSDPAILSGEPVFEGTRIPVDHIVGLVRRGLDPDELREDYPTLEEVDLAYATMLARMKADPGRPRKPLALVRQRAGLNAEVALSQQRTGST